MKTIIAFALLAAFAGAVLGHGPGHELKAGTKLSHASAEEAAFGRAGSPQRISRTIYVDMSDAMRFSPERIEVRQNETIRFIVKNSGKAMHEMVIGTMAGLKEHHAMMMKHPGMEHDEPYLAHVAPGRSESIVWQFTRAGEFFYGCLVPGHFEGGMIGRVVVR